MNTTLPTLPPLADLQRRFASARGNRRALKDVSYDVGKLIRQVNDETTPTGALSAQSQALFDGLYDLHNELADALTRLDRLDAIDQASFQPRDRAERAFDGGLVNFPIHGMILNYLGIKPPPGLDLGQALEQSAELQRRANRTFSGFAAPLQMLAQRRSLVTRADVISPGLPATGPGRHIIPLELDASRFVDALRAQPIVRQAGAQIISGLVGDLDIPRLKETGQVFWFEDGQRITQTDQKFDRINFRVHHCGSYSAYSRSMMLQSTPDIQGIIIDDLQRLLFLDVDRVVLTGSGRGGEPLGILRQIDPIPATRFSYLNNIELRAQLTGRNVPLDSCAYVGNSRIDAYSLSALDAMSRPLGKQLIYAGYPDFTSNVFTAPAVPGEPPLPRIDDPLLFGAFSDVYISFWQELDVSPNEWADEFWFTGAIGIRVLMTMDTNIRHLSSMTWMNCLEGPEVPPLINLSLPPDAAAHRPDRRPAPSPSAHA